MQLNGRLRIAVDRAATREIELCIVRLMIFANEMPAAEVNVLYSGVQVGKVRS